MQFALPFVREIILGAGIISARRHALESWLSKSGDRAIYLVPGGAREQFYLGTNKLVLKDRKGMIKLAMKFGAVMVPCWVFGEREMFPPPPRGKYWDKLWGLSKVGEKKGCSLSIEPGSMTQSTVLQRYLGYVPVPGTPPLIMPPRRPKNGIRTVLGAPLRFPLLANPTDREGHPKILVPQNAPEQSHPKKNSKNTPKTHGLQSTSYSEYIQRVTGPTELFLPVCVGSRPVAAAGVRYRACSHFPTTPPQQIFSTVKPRDVYVPFSRSVG